MLERRNHEGKGGHTGSLADAAKISDKSRGVQWRLKAVLSKHKFTPITMEPPESIMEGGTVL